MDRKNKNYILFGRKNKIKTFEQFVNEKHDPLEGECSISIGKKNYTFNVGKLVRYIEKKYESSDIYVKESI